MKCAFHKIWYRISPQVMSLSLFRMIIIYGAVKQDHTHTLSAVQRLLGSYFEGSFSTEQGLVQKCFLSKCWSQTPSRLGYTGWSGEKRKSEYMFPCTSTTRSMRFRHFSPGLIRLHQRGSSSPLLWDKFH